MDDRTFELIEKLYSEFVSFRQETRERFEGIDKRFEGIDKRFEGIDKRFEGIDKRFDSIEKRLAFIEQDHGKKLQALFDGYKQHSDQLDRIEALVSNMRT